MLITDRSETAKYLLELGADASDKDDSGQPALVLMITKMPAVVRLTLFSFSTQPDCFN